MTESRAREWQWKNLTVMEERVEMDGTFVFRAVRLTMKWKNGKLWKTWANTNEWGTKAQKLSPVQIGTAEKKDIMYKSRLERCSGHNQSPRVPLRISFCVLSFNLDSFLHLVEPNKRWCTSKQVPQITQACSTRGCKRKSFIVQHWGHEEFK